MSLWCYCWLSSSIFCPMYIIYYCIKWGCFHFLIFSHYTSYCIILCDFAICITSFFLILSLTKFWGKWVSDCHNLPWELALRAVSFFTLYYYCLAELYFVLWYIITIERCDNFFPINLPTWIHYPINIWLLTLEFLSTKIYWFLCIKILLPTHYLSDLKCDWVMQV